MGLEAECIARVGRKTSAGKAQLESETLIFRGDFRLDIPFDRIREVTVDGDTLVVAADDEVRLELGAQAAQRWLKHIKQPKGLFEKLELEPNARIAIVDLTDALFVAALRERAGSIAEGRVPEGAPVIFFGAETREALRKVPILRTRMIDTGVLWVVRPKGSKTISEADVLAAVREGGLVDVKVVALSRTHTAHKCVIPLEMRGTGRRRPAILSIPPPAPGTPGGSASGSERSAPRSARPPANAKKKTEGPKKTR